MAANKVQSKELKKFAEIKMNPRNDHLVVQVQLINEKPFVGIRVFYTGDDMELHPTQKGVNIKPELFDEVLDALNQVKKELPGLLADAKPKEGI